MPERHSALMGPRTPRKPVVAFDIETGDRYPDARSCIIQIAAYRMSPDLQTVLDHRQCYVRPACPVSPGAAEVNGYSPDDPRWLKAPTIEQVLPRFVDWLHTKPRPRLLGHNILGFDIPILKAWCEQLGVKWQRGRFPIDYHAWDTMYSAVPLQQWGGISGISLSSVAAHHGVVVKQTHDADADAWACVEIARQQLRYLWASSTCAQYALGFWGHHSDPATREHRLEPVGEAA